ncbi:MAG TPA: hypothetical protein PKI01_06195 [Bacteroidales bacterium]|nr:hypothetical protein [Bacteroidales bacterium]
MNKFLKKRKTLTAVLIILTLLLLLLFFNHVVIIENPIIENLVFIHAYVGIVLLFLDSLFSKRLWAKISLGITFGLFGLILLPFVFIAFLDTINIISWGGVDKSYRCLNEIKYGNKSIKAYLYDPGAMSRTSVSVKLEKRIFPGLKTTKNLY